MAPAPNGTAPYSLPLQQQLRNVDAALRSGDTATAARLANDAVAAGAAHINLLVLAGYHHISLGAFERAAELGEAAREENPRSTDVLHLLGQAYGRLNRPHDALRAYEAALRQTPAVAALHFGKARALEDMGEIVRAAREFERTLDLEPAHGDALSRLSFLLAQRRQGEKARGFADRALRINPRAVVAHLAIALCDVDDGAFQPALDRLAPLANDAAISGVNAVLVRGLMGDAFDGLGQHKNAFTAYTASNNAQIALYRPMIEVPGVERAAQRVTRLRDYFQHASADAWAAQTDGAQGAVDIHVFLVGFPRSGTTLLENALASHADVEALEERQTLDDGEQEFVVPPDGLDRLAHADAATLEKYRKAYWKRVAAETQMPKRKVFVDKLPLNSVLLPLIAKLFPRAKIIFALRDPRDVVLSCFRRRFEMNAQMYEFLSLKGTAAYYDAVMGLCDVYRAKLGLPMFDAVYEHMIGDFEGELRRLCDFLGIVFDPSMLNFSERAKNIATPSAGQVARGLYTHGAGQWRAYAKQLDPVMPQLAPWIARYGMADIPE